MIMVRNVIIVLVFSLHGRTPDFSSSREFLGVVVVVEDLVVDIFFTVGLTVNISGPWYRS